MTEPLLPPAVWQGLQFEWLWVYHGDVPRVETWSGEITVPAGWFWVERGLARMEAEGRVTEVRPGQSFFSAPGARRQWFAAGTRLLSVGFRCLTPAGLPLFRERLNVAMPRAASEPVRQAARTLFHAVHGRRRLVPFLEASVPAARTLAAWCDHEAAFRDWFRVYLRAVERLGARPAFAHRSPDPRLDRLLTGLSEWPLDQPLRLVPLARQSGLGERRARDLLRARLGLSPQAWLERRRLDFARAALMADTPPVKEIAFALGFRHAPHFTAWFKRATTLTPTAFRAAHRLTEAV
jgi:AraC-like DNA-binding protein